VRAGVWGAAFGACVKNKIRMRKSLMNFRKSLGFDPNLAVFPIFHTGSKCRAPSGLQIGGSVKKFSVLGAGAFDIDPSLRGNTFDGANANVPMREKSL